MKHIDATRRMTARGLIILLWLYVAAFLAATLASGTMSGLLPCGLGIAAASTGIYWRLGAALLSRLAIGVALASMVSLSNMLLASASVREVEALACLAVLAACLDWRMVAIATAALMGQWAAMAWGGLLPAEGSWPGQTAIVIIAAAILTWLTREIETMPDADRAARANAAALAEQGEHVLRLASEAANELAAQAAEDRVARELEHGVGGMVRTLVVDAVTAAQAVRQAVSMISGVTEETARRSAAMEEGSQEASTNAQLVATSVEKLAASIALVTANLRGVSDASFRAMDDAASTNQTVQLLADTAGRIGNVTQAISAIARRTNMLALNATIEAARAGDAGLGFNVVANEVKDLAKQTAKATAEILQEIGLISSQVIEATTAIDGMAATVAELGGATATVAYEMDDQAEIARTISESALRTAAGTDAVVTNLRGLTETATRGDEAAHDGVRDADRLAETCGAVQVAMRDFVKTLTGG